MEEEKYGKKHMRKEDLPPEEEEKTSEVWIEESKERTSSAVEEEHEKGKTPRVDTDLPTFEGKTTVNPPSGGGKILKGTRGETAAGARCGYPSKPCDR
ncbi:hypothetical protein [Methanobacterium sp.]|uniref:hypothetical protein n=1 Tax=Methanobacterium sp. TaxID=2164 RepID=UPI003C70F228